ncbi:MAG: hypothetical protein ACE5F3_08200 [Mariprofundaceae bacterium]
MFLGLLPAMRKIHIWVGLGILLPVLIVSITAILLAHKKELGLEEIPLSYPWLPGYVTTSQKHDLEIKATLHVNNGLLLGTKFGLYLWRDGTLTPIEAFNGKDIRSIVAWAGGVMVAAKQGVWAQVHGQWLQIYSGDAHGIAVDDSGWFYLAAHKKGLLFSDDGGRTWRAAETTNEKLLKMRPAEPETIDLKKLIKDLHTGQAFVGRPSEWMWIDALSGLLVISSILGFYVWWRKRRNYF